MMSVLVGAYCGVVMGKSSMSIMQLPRSIFDRLPGVEIERIDARSNRTHYVKSARLNDCIDVTFFCDEPSLPARRDADRLYSDRWGEISLTSE